MISLLHPRDWLLRISTFTCTMIVVGGALAHGRGRRLLRLSIALVAFCCRQILILGQATDLRAYYKGLILLPMLGNRSIFFIIVATTMKRQSHHDTMNAPSLMASLSSLGRRGKQSLLFRLASKILSEIFRNRQFIHMPRCWDHSQGSSPYLGIPCFSRNERTICLAPSSVIH